jgi:hypothetical protein
VVRASCDSDLVIERVNARLAEESDIHHTTLQLGRVPHEEAIYHATQAPGRWN